MRRLGSGTLHTECLTFHFDGAEHDEKSGGFSFIGDVIATHQADGINRLGDTIRSPCHR